MEPSCNPTNVWNSDKLICESWHVQCKIPPLSTVGSYKTGRRTYVDAQNDGGHTVRGRRIYVDMDDCRRISVYKNNKFKNLKKT